MRCPLMADIVQCTLGSMHIRSEATCCTKHAFVKNTFYNFEETIFSIPKFRKHTCLCSFCSNSKPLAKFLFLFLFLFFLSCSYTTLLQLRSDAPPPLIDNRHSFLHHIPCNLKYYILFIWHNCIFWTSSILAHSLSIVFVVASLFVLLPSKENYTKANSF